MLIVGGGGVTMSRRAVRLMALMFFGAAALLLGQALIRSNARRDAGVESTVYTTGFAEQFQPFLGHGPDARWAGCWLERAAVDVATFAYVCPGEVEIDVEARLTSTSIWESCPYLLTTGDTDPRFEKLSEELCTILPERPGSWHCCDRSRRGSTIAIPQVSLARHPDSRH